MKRLLIIPFLLSFHLLQAQTVREFSLKGVDAKNYTYAELKGEKLTIIDFWASWCKPCMKAIPKIDNIYQHNKDKGVNVIGINCDGPRSVSKVAPLVSSLGISYTVLTDINTDVMKDLEVASLPTLLIVDANNKVVYRHEGFSDGDELEIQKKIDFYLKK